MTRLSGHVHIIGAGGSGMSGIARVLLARGVKVSGSDARQSRRLSALEPLGAHVYVGHDSGRMVENGLPDVVVVSTAIPESNPEIIAANELKIPVLHRSTALSELIEGHIGISVSGCHGKTTTTSMMTVVLQYAGLDPSFVIGSEINESGSNAHQGSGPHFVVEADESDGTFLVLPTTAAIVTNIEPDHLNFWQTFEALEQAYIDFMEKPVQRGGITVTCGDDPGVAKVLPVVRASGARVVTYGTEEGNDARVHLIPNQSAGCLFTIDYHGKTYGPVQLAVPGRHNALNATAVFITSLELGVDVSRIIEGLQAYSGAHRRFEFRGESNGVRIFDDIAHHPTEVDAVLRAARNVVGDGRVIIAFQAHHYYRTEMFMDEFAEALGLADYAVVLEIFAPGETPIPGISGVIMASKVPLPSDQVVFEPSWSAVPELLANQAQPGDIIMTLGGSDIGMMCPQILDLLNQKFSDVH